MLWVLITSVSVRYRIFDMLPLPWMFWWICLTWQTVLTQTKGLQQYSKYPKILYTNMSYKMANSANPEGLLWSGFTLFAFQVYCGMIAKQKGKKQKNKNRLCSWLPTTAKSPSLVLLLLIAGQMGGWKNNVALAHPYHVGKSWSKFG